MCYLRPWLGPFLITVQYVVYFVNEPWFHIMGHTYVAHGIHWQYQCGCHAAASS